jgi:hypothetical protein
LENESDKIRTHVRSNPSKRSSVRNIGYEPSQCFVLGVSDGCLLVPLKPRRIFSALTFFSALHSIGQNQILVELAVGYASISVQQRQSNELRVISRSFFSHGETLSETSITVQSIAASCSSPRNQRGKDLSDLVSHSIFPSQEGVLECVRHSSTADEAAMLPSGKFVQLILLHKWMGDAGTSTPVFLSFVAEVQRPCNMRLS